MAACYTGVRLQPSEEKCHRVREREEQVSSASRYCFCVVFARSLCEAKRPSDLKVSPFHTMRPPDVCCWRHPRYRERKRESEEERDENTARKSKRDMERENKKKKKNGEPH